MFVWLYSNHRLWVTCNDFWHALHEPSDFALLIEVTDGMSLEEPEMQTQKNDVPDIDSKLYSWQMWLLHYTI